MVRIARTVGRHILNVAGGVSLCFVSTMPVMAEDNPALKILKSMSDYVDSQTTIEATFDSSIEVVTTSLEKIQFDSSGEVTLDRPSHVHVRRTGGFSDAEFFFDGKTATITDVTDHRYASFEAPGTIEHLRDMMSRQGGVSFPGGELLAKGSFATLSADVTEAKYIGPAVIGGMVCDHLAFRTAEVDWQLWVQTGDKPAPCKMVVTSKTVQGSPQYSVQVTSFKTGMSLAEDKFTFKPAAGAKEVSLSVLSDIDELPPESK